MNETKRPAATRTTRTTESRDARLATTSNEPTERLTTMGVRHEFARVTHARAFVTRSLSTRDRFTRAGHAVATQCESDEDARRVLNARFQGVRQAREASEMEGVPKDVDVLICGVMAREYEGSWRESWTRNGAAGGLRHEEKCLGMAVARNEVPTDSTQ